MENLQGVNRFKKVKTGIILVYFILNGLLLILSFQMNVDDLKYLVKMARYIPYFRYIASANMLLIIIVITMYYLELKKLHKRNKAAEREVVTIKSRLYDLEEEKKGMIKKYDQEDYHTIRIKNEFLKNSIQEELIRSEKCFRSVYKGSSYVTDDQPVGRGYCRCH
jgi:DNA integrity scanning protein DisA with diadenylate cyclase activity